MRRPIAPASYRTAETRDLSWDENGRCKAVAIEFRNPADRPLYLIYRQEPAWLIEEADTQAHARFSNFLSFYPWPEPDMADTTHVAELATTEPTRASITVDGHPIPSQRYRAGLIIVDIAFLDGASISIGRPADLLQLPPLHLETYESNRPDLPPDHGEYHGYLHQRPGGDFQH